MDKRIPQLVAIGFAVLIALGLVTNIFLALAVQRTLEAQQQIESTAIEARAATRSLRADYLDMGSAVGAALLESDLKTGFHKFWVQKEKFDARADAHLKTALQHAYSEELRGLLTKLKAHNDGVTEPLESQLLQKAAVNDEEARRFYLVRFLPALRQNIKFSEAALVVAIQNVLDLQEDVAIRASYAQMIARRAILLFALLGLGSGFFLTRSVNTIVRQGEQDANANRNMLEYSQDVICSIDAQGRFINVSRACERVWGRSPQELRGTPFQDLLHPDDVHKTVEIANDIAAGLTVKDFENRYIRKDGEVVDLLWSAHWSAAEQSMFCVARDVTERKEAQEKMRRLALFDGLTGLMNRGAIIGHLEREMEHAGQEGHPLGVVLLDLDHFKRVNDTYGHAAGDAVLKEAARRMKDAMRGADVVGRYGGEEFLVVAPGLSGENVVAVAERVRLAVKKTPIDIGEKTLQVGCSLGATVMLKGENEGIDALIERADAALYRAKAAGRDRVEMAL